MLTDLRVRRDTGWRGKEGRDTSAAEFEGTPECLLSHLTSLSHPCLLLRFAGGGGGTTIGLSRHGSCQCCHMGSVTSTISVTTDNHVRDSDSLKDRRNTVKYEISAPPFRYYVVADFVYVVHNSHEDPG